MSTARWLWIGVAAFPVVVGLITGVVALATQCDWGYHGLDVFLAEFLLVPLVVAGWSALAGAVSLRGRGAVAAVLGALGGGIAGLVWGPLALFVSFGLFAEAAC